MSWESPPAWGGRGPPHRATVGQLQGIDRIAKLDKFQVSVHVR